MSQVAHIADCPETLEEARQIIRDAADKARRERDAAIATGISQDEHTKALAEVARLSMELHWLKIAARRVVASARRASTGQDLVLRSDLLELARTLGEPLNTTL